MRFFVEKVCAFSFFTPFCKEVARIEQMAKQRLKVPEYARIMQCDASTIYRKIQQGKLETEKIDGALHVLVDEDELQGHDIASEYQRIQLLLNENVVKATMCLIYCITILLISSAVLYASFAGVSLPRA